MADKYTPYPIVESKFTPTPKIEEKFPQVEISNAVGKALEIVGHGTGVLGEAYKMEGQAWDRLGAQTSKAGGELFERAAALKQLDIQKEVDDATLKLSNQSSDAVEEHGASLGENAVKGAPAVRKNIMDMRTQISNGLTSDIAKREFNGKTINIINSDFRRITAHAKEQDLVLKKTTNEAMVKNLIDRASRADNQQEKNSIMDELDAQIDYGHHLYGRPGKPEENPVTIMQRREAAQEVTEKTINLMAAKDPDKAWAELQRAYKAGEVSSEKYPQLYHSTKAQLVDTGVRGGVSDAWDPKGSLEAMQKKAAEAAANYATKAGAPEFAEEMATKAIQAIDGKFNAQKAAENDTHVKDHNNFSRMISGKSTNQWLYTKEELFAATGNPDKALADFNNLPEAMQNSLETMMRRGPQGGPETPAARSLVNQWKYALDGLGTDEQRLAAMSRNPYDEKLNLPIAWANELRNKIEEQEKIGKAAKADPHVKAAVDVFSEYAPGVLKDKTSAQYAAAIGELSSVVEAKVNQLKRNLTYDENKAAVLTVIRNQNISLDAGSPLTIPSKEYNSYVAGARQAEPNITEQEIKNRYQQWIMYGQYRALLEKTPPAQTPAKAPAPTAPAGLFNPGRM